MVVLHLTIPLEQFFTEGQNGPPHNSYTFRCEKVSSQLLATMKNYIMDMLAFRNIGFVEGRIWKYTTWKLIVARAISTKTGKIILLWPEMAYPRAIRRPE